MDFNESEWQKVNDIHFGKGVRWNTKTFAYRAVDKGKTLGLIFGKHESGTIYISNIIVKEKFRRKGIGTLLMNKAEDYGNKQKDHKIWLISGKNYPEDPFFKKLGFKEEALVQNLYFNHDFKIYTKEIKSQRG